MFVENTKSMLYLFFMVPCLMAFSLFSGIVIKSSGWFGVSSFLLVMTALIIGFLVYSKLPNLKSGRYFTFGISSISDGRKWAYKLAFHLLVIFYFASVVLISGFGS